MKRTFRWITRALRATHSALLAAKTTARRQITHCRLHGGLAGWHGFAAVATDKPEVYLPMAAIYALAAWIDATH